MGLSPEGRWRSILFRQHGQEPNPPTLPTSRDPSRRGGNAPSGYCVGLSLSAPLFPSKSGNRSAGSRKCLPSGWASQWMAIRATASGISTGEREIPAEPAPLHLATGWFAGDVRPAPIDESALADHCRVVVPRVSGADNATGRPEWGGPRHRSGSGGRHPKRKRLPMSPFESAAVLT